ncbi:MAG: UDP-glucose 4-epimerase GalE [Bacillota bacterium]|nr:UDP-glucose 4-epimerase GalE [Bacillota bacterium]
MKILVTGGAGYIGSHTVKKLLGSGYSDITVIDDLSTGEKTRIPSGVTFVEGDFADRELLGSLFESGVDTVIHFAASKVAPESVTEPEKYYDNNVAKSIILLEQCIKNDVKNFIFSSSAAVYGDVQGFPITEEFETKPTNPYGWSKLMFEQVLRDSSLAHGLKHVSLRYFNAGGADPEGELGNNHEKGEDVISILMRTAKKNGVFTIYGCDYRTKDGTCVRDLIHVSDLASAHVAALEYLHNGGESTVVNLGSEEGFTIRDIAERTKKITGSDFKIAEGDRRQGDIVVSIASSKKARDILKWKRNYSDIDNLIRTAWEWEKKQK